MIAKTDLTILTLASACVIIGLMKLGPVGSGHGIGISDANAQRTPTVQQAGSTPTLLNPVPSTNTSSQSTSTGIVTPEVASANQPSADPSVNVGNEPKLVIEQASHTPDTQTPVGNTATAFPSPESTQVHVVRSGESLSVIAQRYDTTVQQLMALNNLDNYTIYVGQELLYEQ